MKVQGFYTYMTDVDKDKKKGLMTKTGIFLSHSRIIGFSYFFILLLFAYLLIISFNKIQTL